MARTAQVALRAQVAVFGFNPEPDVPSSRAISIVVEQGRLPSTDVGLRESVAEAVLRTITSAGIAAGGRRGGRSGQSSPELVGLGDDSSPSGRTLTLWYIAATHHVPELGGAARWVPPGRSLRLDVGGAGHLRVAMERLRQDTRYVGGAVRLLGDVFTGDDLLRLQVAVYGGTRGSERTFRRRVQELRDGGVLRPVRESEVGVLRERTMRFRSPAGTGGRPPELLRYGGGGDEEEPLAGLRARRSG